MKRHTFFALGLTVLVLSFIAVMPGLDANEEMAYQSGSRRDPFIPLISKDGTVIFSMNTSDLHVEGIVFDPIQGSLALINGEFYKPGDDIEDLHVISIFKDRVILQQDDEEKTLWIREEIVENDLKTVTEGHKLSTRPKKEEQQKDKSN